MIKILFMGTPQFAAVSLQALLDCDQIKIAAVVTQQDRPAGRGMKLTPSPVKTLALEHGVAILQPASVKRQSTEFIDQLQQYAPFDLGVVVAFGQILPRALLDLPARGCINLHASILPRWRGAAPIQRAILAGDKETGVCVMHMEEGLDSGAVFACQRTPIASDDTSDSLSQRLAQIGAKLLLDTIAPIVNETLKAAPQAEINVTYANKISRQDTLIDWSAQAQQIERQVRAFAPRPGAVTQLRGHRLKVTQGQVSHPDNRPQAKACGSIVQLSRDTVEVQCGQGSYLIHKLQLEGKREMTVRDFVAGTPLSIGEVFS